MNETIKSEVQTIINEFRDRIGGKATRHQYAAGKKQIAHLTALGLIEYMPSGFGHGDADAVLAAAMDAPKEIGGTVNGDGDVTTTSGSALWKLLNPPPAPEPTPEPVVDEPASEPMNEPESDRIYKVMMFDDSLDCARAQQRWQDVPELSREAAAAVAANFIERGGVSMEIFSGLRSAGALGEIISLTAGGTISVNDAVDMASDSALIRDVAYISAAIQNALRRRWQLEGVMTAAEAAVVFGLAEPTVRQTLNRGQIAGRKSGGTWLIRRADAEARWGKRDK